MTKQNNNNLKIVFSLALIALFYFPIISLIAENIYLNKLGVKEYLKGVGYFDFFINAIKYNFLLALIISSITALSIIFKIRLKYFTALQILCLFITILVGANNFMIKPKTIFHFKDSRIEEVIPIRMYRSFYLIQDAKDKHIKLINAKFVSNIELKL